MTRFFATCVMFAGLRLGLTLSVAALFGAIAGVIAYPPMSTPYVDNHAAIVSSLLVLGIVLGIMDADKRPMWWLLAPPLAIVAFLCKQSPTIFVVAFYGVAIFFTAWHQGAIRDLIYVPVASVLCSLVTVLVAPALFWHPSCPFQWMAARGKSLTDNSSTTSSNPAVTLLFWMEHELGWVSRSKIFAGWTRVSGQTRCAASEDSR